MQSLKNKCSEHELNCIRFYMGDPDVQVLFRGGLKAYNTMNALLHKNIQNEIDLVKEGRIVELFDRDHLNEMIDVIISIYKAMIHENMRDHRVVYKVDRYSTIVQMIHSQRIEGFFSTCKYGYLEEYAHIKKDVVLLEIVLDDVYYLDFEYLFKDKYAKANEAEILIPFDTKISLIEEIELLDEEKELYYDMDMNQPIGKYRIHLVSNNSSISNHLNEYDLFNEFDRVQLCISHLMNHSSLNDDDLEFYVNWKENLKSYILSKIFE